MTIVVFALAALSVVFTLIAVAVPVATRIRLPLPVVIAGAGLALGFGSVITGIGLEGNALDTYDLWFVDSLALDAKALLAIFLPPLLFEMALGVNVRRLLDDVAMVLVMAVVAVVAATALVGVTLWAVSPVGLVACLLLGAAISTTDPAAVVTTFREIGAPRRLLVILEGESLLNDAAAIALFSLLLSLLAAEAVPSIDGLVAAFAWSFAVGAATGIAVAWAASRLYPFLGGSSVAETTLTVAVAYGAYLLADAWLGASGVVAVVFAGLTTTVRGIVRMGPGNWSTVYAVWTQIGFWASALILLLVAIVAPSMLLGLRWHEAALLAVVYAGAFAARALVLFGLLPGLSRLGLTAPMNRPQKTLVLWGGVRGAVTLVLALSLSEIAALDQGERTVIAALAAGYALLTLVVNAASLSWVTRLLGLDRLSASDVALRERVVAGVVGEVRAYVEGLAAERGVDRAVIDGIHAEYEAQIRDLVAHGAEIGIPFGERLRIGLTILAGQEARIVQAAFDEGEIGPEITRALRAVADRIADAARLGGRDGYEAAMTDSLAVPRSLRRAMTVQRWLRTGRPLRGVLAHRLALLLEMRNTVSDLRRFVDAVLPAMIGTDAARNLARLVERRGALVDAQVEAIRLQYPRYAEALERIRLLRAAARQERRQYDRFLADGIIGPELHRDLARDLDRRWRRLDRPPALDLGLSRRQLLDQVPMFAGLDAARRRRIAKRLQMRLAAPGERIVAAGERRTEMFFIVSGVVEVRGLGAPVRLSNGDFFGELALLAPNRRRRTDVVALGYCRLLVLTRREFARLMARDPEIERTIREAAEHQLGGGFKATVPEEMDWRRDPPEATAPQRV